MAWELELVEAVTKTLSIQIPIKNNSTIALGWLILIFVVAATGVFQEISTRKNSKK